MFEFEITHKAVRTVPLTKIALIGVGGAGGNMVNHFISLGRHEVSCLAVNTDAQALDGSLAHERIMIGAEITKGRGAGADPEIGRVCAEHDLECIIQAVGGVDMVCLVGGLGGGTASGAMAVLARAFTERGILTVSLVTKPFSFEGKRRLMVADQAEEQLAKIVDTLMVISNETLIALPHTDPLLLSKGFSLVNEIVSNCIVALSDIILKPGLINVDFADIKTVMKGRGRALIGSSRAQGPQRALTAADGALHSPFFGALSLRGAQSVLVNVTAGNSLTLDEVQTVVSRITEDADAHATIIMGTVLDESLQEDLLVTVVATGFTEKSVPLSAKTGDIIAATAKPVTAPFMPKQAAFSVHDTRITSMSGANKTDGSLSILKDHPLRDVLPSLEKRLKDQYLNASEELEVPALIRKLAQEKKATEVR